MTDKIDPYDVAALEKAVNDSATRVSTIWISYLIFGLYLVTAAETITHRQLFLADPIKLPVLNIDLPLVGFFFLAPILFVIFHGYVLIQLVLLARTAAAYDDAVEKSIKNEIYRDRVRYRLANTLFAQIFAGSPRERKGLLGSIMRLMAWLTLAIGPIGVLIVFEITFLPYHSFSVTWTHRVLIAADLLVVLLLWNGALNPRRNIVWRALLESWKTSLAALILALAACIVPTFPGELHAEWTRYTPAYNPGPRNPTPPPKVNACSKRSIIHWISINFDRISVPAERFTNNDQIAKIADATSRKDQQPYEGERTHKFYERNLSCGDFSGTDLRRSDFEGVSVFGTNFDDADLQGALFKRAVGGDASFKLAQLRGASFEKAIFPGAFLNYAYLQGAHFYLAQFQGASFDSAQLQGSSFNGAELQGASLFLAQLQGANLVAAKLHGAFLHNADLAGASLVNARLQAANLDWATLNDVSLDGARMQGVSLHQSKLALAFISKAMVWQADPIACIGDDAPLVIDPELQDMLEIEPGSTSDNPNVTWSAAIDSFVRATTAKSPSPVDLEKQLRSRLTANKNESTPNSTESVASTSWRACATPGKRARSSSQYDTLHAASLLRLACASGPDQKEIVAQTYQNWVRFDSWPMAFRRQIAQKFLDEKSCPGAADLTQKIKVDLRKIAASKEN